jgi:glycosyltransferase involved in cell wall biosynthesis/SAM-dependent methyltransferase
MTYRPKTLVLLTPAFPADESPVNWVTTQQLFVRTLRSQYPDVRLIILTFYYPYSISSYEWHGIQVRSFDGQHRRKLRRPLFWLDIWRQLRRIRKESDLIGLFSFWCGECALIGTHFGRRYGIRHFCWLCGQDAKADNKLVKFIRPRPEELIAMSDFLVDEFYRNHGIRPLYMIPNGIGPEEFPPDALERASAGVAKRDIDLIGVGTLSSFKRYDLLVTAVGALQDVFPGIKAIHCGEGEEKERILAMIRELGLEGNISLLGETPHRVVLGYLQRTKILLHPSEYEGFGVVCLEALYAGAHVISFVRPIHRHIPHWHVVGSQEEMIATARGLLASSDTEYGSVAPFTMKSAVDSVMQLFGGAIEQNSAYHDQAAETYDRTMDKDPVNNVIRRRVREKMSHLLSSGTVLDFGGGTGADLGWLTEKKYDVLFCEPSVPMREKAIQYNRSRLHSDRITFLETDSTDFSNWHEKLPFSQKTDAILSNFGALNYIPDIRRLFANMARVVKCGGHFVLLVLDMPLPKRWSWHRRNALRSLVFGAPFVLYIPYDGERRQTVFVHSLKEIKAASAPYFTFESAERPDAPGFTLIHLIRNEKPD